MNWQELRRILTMHEVWVASDGDDGKQADLSGADLRGKFLNHANLRGARMANANLTGASLEGAYLIGANLFRSRLVGADLRDADLSRANLEEADLREVRMTYTKISEANLKGINLARANLRFANFERANLHNAKLQSANLYDANLEGANLENANLVNAYINFQRTNLRGANLTGTILAPSKFEEKVVYGRQRRGAKALQKVTAPMQIAAFKRAFPQAFETIKMDLTGGTLDPERAKKLLDAYGLVWWVSKTQYKSRTQRLSKKPNDVLQMNVDIALLTDDSNLLGTLEAIRNTSIRSDHPVFLIGLFTIGWIRYGVFKKEKVVMVEEIQSDLWIVRNKLDDEEFQNELRARGCTDEHIRGALALLKPFVERFYQDALSLIFDVAEELGFTVEMLPYYQHKEEEGAPAHVYETLPRSMGMKKTADFKSPIEARKLWQIKPNPARGRSGSIPDAFLWRGGKHER